MIRLPRAGLKHDIIILFNEFSSSLLMTNQLQQTLAVVFANAMGYGNDDTVAPQEIKNFLDQHYVDFEEMVMDFVGERL